MYAEEIFCALDLNGTGKQQHITVALGLQFGSRT